MDDTISPNTMAIWRRALHILIAAAIGNLWCACCAMVGDWGPIQQADNGALWLLWAIGPAIIGYAIARLSRAPKGTRRSLAAAMVLVSLIPLYSGYGEAPPLSVDVFHCTLAIPLMAAAGYSAVAIAFLGGRRGVSVKRVAYAILLGALLVALGMLSTRILLRQWHSDILSRWIDARYVQYNAAKSSALGCFLAISVNGPFSISHAVVASFLLTSLAPGESQARRWSRLRIVALVIAVLGAMGALFIAEHTIHWVWWVRPGLRADVDELRKTNLARFTAPPEPIPAPALLQLRDGNAADDYIAAMKAYHSSSTEGDLHYSLLFEGGFDDGKFDEDTIRSFLDESETIHLMKRGAMKRECRFPLKAVPGADPWEGANEDGRFSFDLMLYRGTIRALCYEASVMARKGHKPPKAMLQAIRFSNQLSASPHSFLDFGVALPCRSIVLDHLVEHAHELGMDKYRDAYKRLQTEEKQRDRLGSGLGKTCKMDIWTNPYMLEYLLDNDLHFLTREAELGIRLKRSPPNLIHRWKLWQLRRKVSRGRPSPEE